MMRILMLAGVLVLAACANNNQSSADAVAAQQLLPTIAGYNTSDVDSIVDALTAAGSGAMLAQGNLPAAGAIARAEAVVQCLQDRGAVGGRTYVQQTLSEVIPQAGVAVVINQNRLNENFLGCLLTGPGNFSAQAVTIEPCANAGTFTYQNNTYSFVYVGVGSDLCGYFSQHFITNLGGTGSQ